jgi:hypothetical protein
VLPRERKPTLIAELGSRFDDDLVQHVVVPGLRYRAASRDNSDPI